MTRLRVMAMVLAASLLLGLVALWPRQERGIVLYSSVGAAPAVAAAFTAETGVAVSLITLSGGPLLARISAEAHHPSWTVAWFEGDPAAASLDQSGLLARHATPALDWSEAGRALLPADGAWTPTGFTLAGVFAYRADAADPPDARWGHLMDGGIPGRGAARFGMPDPSLSGTAYPMLTGLLAQGGGWHAGPDLARQLERASPRILPSGPMTVLALRRGQIPIAVVQSSIAFALAAGDPGFRVTLPEPATVLPSLAVVAADAAPARQALARRFIRFVMTPRIQALRMAQPSGDRLFWPVTTDTVQMNLPALRPAELLHPDPYVWGPLQATVTDWFQQTVARR